MFSVGGREQTSDDELSQLAVSGELTKPEVMRTQVKRLLADARSDAFVKNFAGQWLGLRKVGAKTRFPSLEISDMSGTGGAGHSHTLTFDRNGTPLPAENSPQRLFERLFVPDDAASREVTLKCYAKKHSILDDVLGEARALDKKLGRSDQTKLAEYLASVRETELRVQRQVEWVDVPKSKIDP